MTWVLGGNNTRLFPSSEIRGFIHPMALGNLPEDFFVHATISPKKNGGHLSPPEKRSFMG